MAKTQTPEAELDMTAVDFDLPATDGRSYRLADVAGPDGLVIAFICNHCPYVKAMIDRFVADARLLMDEGIGVAAICSNDADAYPEDAPDKMALFAAAHRFPFPYLHDEDQSVARDYGAVCTPDIFGFDGAGRLRYRGRLDEGRAGPLAPGARREMLEAMRLVARTGEGPVDQVPSIGCSIKWKPD